MKQAEQTNGILASRKSDASIYRMVVLLISLMLLSILIGKAYPGLRVRAHRLWIESPTGHTTESLPFYLALRVVRKHKWRLVDTQPCLTRWQAFLYSIGVNKILGKERKNDR